MLFAIGELGLRLDVGTVPPDLGGEKPAAPCAFCISLLGELEDGQAVAATTRFLAERKMNIREIRTLSEGGLRGMELIADVLTPVPCTDQGLAGLRGEILGLARTLGVDMAVQRDGVFRRNKRLICMVVDSTFIQMEVVDELAKLVGVGERVAAITERAMKGEIDFKTALRERVTLLAGLPLAKARELLDNVPMTPGAERLVRTLQALGLKVGLVSGGFTFFVDALKQRFGLDFAFANHLEVVDGVLTGRVLGSIVDAERKAQLLRDMAHVYQCRLEQCVAVGDGANDILMLQSAGLGVAFRGKPRLQAAADLSLNRSSLDDILYLMGLHEADLGVLDAEDGNA